MAHSKDNKRFANQVVLITGASSGIGMAAALAFAKEGAGLVLAARRLERLTDVAAACRALGVPCEVVEADVQNYPQVEHLVKVAMEKFGRIDVLINNAGIGFFTPFHSQSWESISHTLRTNLEGAMALTHAVIPHMLKRGSGTILNVSSVVGKRSVANWASYCASKFGMWGFSQSLELELRPHGIHVCHFCPAATATEFHAVAGLAASHSPASGMASAERVAAAIVEAVYRRKREVIVSAAERIVIKLYLLAPGLTEKLLGWVRKTG